MRRVIRQIVWGIVGVALSWLATGAGLAKEEGSSAQPVAAPAVAPAAPQPATVQKSPKEQKQEEVRAQLNGTSWLLHLRSEVSGKQRDDALTFAGRTVTSDWLSKAGYNTSNYSLRIEDNGLIVWETMQSKEGEGVAFWRGELQGNVMSGVLSKQPSKGSPESFSFTASKADSGTPPEPPVAVSAPSPTEAAAPSPVQEASQSASTPEPQAPTKKKGWFGR